MKIFQLNVSFVEPTEAVITLNADSQEAAVERVKAELDGKVTNLEIKEIKEVTKLVEETENVIDLQAARAN